MRKSAALSGALLSLGLLAGGIGVVAPPTAFAADIPLEDGCVLSSPHTVASTYYTPPLTALTPSFGSLTTTVDGDYHVRTQPLQVTNVSNHVLYDVSYFAAGAQVSPNNPNYLAAPWDNAATLFRTADSVTWPSPDWEPRTTGTAGATVALSDEATTPPVKQVSAATSGIPLTGSSANGIVIDFAPTDTITAYDFGDIAVSGVESYNLALRIKRPTGDSFVYAARYALAISAQTCLPTPTIDAWPAPTPPGNTPITGTGRTAGDQIEVRDNNNTLIGTAIVQPDLTWSVVPLSPLPIGVNHLKAIETDEFQLTGETDIVPFEVQEASLSLTLLDAEGHSAPTVADASDLSATGGETILTFRVTNDGGGDLHRVQLATSVTSAQLDNLSCDRDILTDPSTVSLPPGDSVTCTGTLRGLSPNGSPAGLVSGTASGLSDSVDSALTADAQYWARYVAVSPTATPNPPTSTASPAPTSSTTVPDPGTTTHDPTPLPNTGGSAWPPLAAGITSVAFGLVIAAGACLHRRRYRQPR